MKSRKKNRGEGTVNVIVRRVIFDDLAIAEWLQVLPLARLYYYWSALRVILKCDAEGE